MTGNIQLAHLQEKKFVFKHSSLTQMRLQLALHSSTSSTVAIRCLRLCKVPLDIACLGASLSVSVLQAAGRAWSCPDTAGSAVCHNLRSYLPMPKNIISPLNLLLSSTIQKAEVQAHQLEDRAAPHISCCKHIVACMHPSTAKTYYSCYVDFTLVQTENG